MNISPIFYMGNKKKLINKGLIDLFPKDINMFVDLFAGSGIVSMNIKANKYIMNDFDVSVYRFYEMFKNKTAEEIISQILSNVNEFKLRRGSIKNDDIEMANHKKAYHNLRNKANRTKDIVDIYSCMFYAFSQQMRFNSKGEFNMPCGNRAFTQENEGYIKNGCDFFSKGNVVITNNDFRKIKIEKLSTNDFVYLDPPYLNTVATYNEQGGWNDQDENDLYALCEDLTKNKIKFAMSNVFENKGIKNDSLIKWVENNNLNVYTFDKFSYYACGKGNTNAQEVLITNY